MDFDFQTGRWHVHNRRLRERLAGCTERDEFEAEVVARPLLGGTANQDEFHTDFGGPMPRWEQALSADDGLTCETNWEMDYTRIEEAA